VISACAASEIGLLEKQSSALFLGKTPLTRFEASIAFNMPRAAGNFNDGFGGGHNFSSSAFWNTCRETGDHGPLNSWQRQPFKSLISTGGTTPTYVAALSATHNMAINAGYGGSQAFDNDDGSSRYDTYDNFFYASDGFKMDYGGYLSLFHDNLIVVREYDGQACYNAGDFNPGFESKIFSNLCVVPMGSDGTPNEMIGHTGSACDGKPAGSGALEAWNNSYFTPLAAATVGCGRGTVNLTDVKPPFEAGSTSNPMPQLADLLAWARSKILL